MSRVEAASGSKYSVHKEPARRYEPIGPVGTNYTPVGKVDIDAIRREAAAKPSTLPQPTRPLGVGKKWSAPATTGFQPKYTPPPPAKPSHVPDDDWEPAPAPVQQTLAPPLPNTTRPTPSAPPVSMKQPHIRIAGFHRGSPHRSLRKSPSQSLHLPSPPRKTVSGLLERTGNRSNFPNLRNSSTRSRDGHRKQYRNNNKPSHRSKRVA